MKPEQDQTPAYWQYDIRDNNSSAVGAKAVVNSETSKIMPWTAAYEQIAEVWVAWGCRRPVAVNCK